MSTRLDRGRSGRPVTGLIAAALVAALVAACSTSAGHPGVATLASASPGAAAPSPGASLDPEAALLAFAKCMRDHGVDMPDPVFDGNGGGRITIGGKTEGGKDVGTALDGARIDAAQTACDHLLPPRDAKDAMSTADQDKLLAFAKCMRDHGVDMPDPDFSGGGVSFSMGGGIDPGSATFQAAQAACGSLMPGKGGTITSGVTPGGTDGGGLTIDGGGPQTGVPGASAVPAPAASATAP